MASKTLLVDLQVSKFAQHQALSKVDKGHAVRSAGIEQPIPPPPAKEEKKAEPAIDREKICPLLLRVFPQFGGHHRLEDYLRHGELPANELQVYTWHDATLRELTDLIKSAQPAARRTTARLEFAFVYPDRKGRNVMRQVGVTHSTKVGEDDTKTLKQLQFQTGDYLDVAIM